MGTFALIDEGETDWKILVIDVKDPLADKINGELSLFLFFKATYMCSYLKPQNELAWESDFSIL